MRKIVSLGVVIFLCVSAGTIGATLRLDIGGSTSANVDYDGGSGSVLVDVYFNGIAGGEQWKSWSCQIKGTTSVSATASLDLRTLSGVLDDDTTPDPTGALSPFNGSDIGATWDGTNYLTADEKVATLTIGWSGAAIGETLLLQLGGPGPMGMVTAPTGDLEGTGSTQLSREDLTITFTPEPMSAMLLLAAAPFIRRRRTA